MTIVQRVLSGRYRIEEPLGQGGMGRVYRAVDQVLDRTVAVKVLSDGLSGDERFEARFEREAQAAARLNHPHVVSVYDAGSDGDSRYIVMEYVEGRTLEEVLRRDGPLDPRRATAIAAGVAAALGAAHRQGIVHRDVKPGNVMITPSGRVKVMDFGIARASWARTVTTATTIGTASYLSPEQAEGRPVDARSDVYSLGVVLYEMLAGRPPFIGEAPVAVALKHVREDPPPLADVRPSVPAALAAVASRAMAKDPAARHQGAEELLEDLRRAAGEGSPAPPIAPPSPARAAAPEGDPVAEAPGDTAVIRREPTAVLRAPPEAPARPLARRRWTVAAIVAVAALVGGIAVVQLVREEEAVTGGGPGRSVAASPSAPSASEPTPSATLTLRSPTLVPASVESAIAALRGLLVSGVEDGVLTEHGAGEIGKDLDEAIHEYEKGNLEEALDKLGEAHDEVNEGAAKGDITSEELVVALHDAIDRLAELMQSSAPTEGDD